MLSALDTIYSSDIDCCVNASTENERLPAIQQLILERNCFKRL
jgi:hypothetical protein